MSAYSLAPAPLRDAVLGTGGLLSRPREKWILALLDTYLYAWEDLKFPSQGINPPGAASDPTRSTATGLLRFSGVNDNVIAGLAQMPHAWAPGTAGAVAWSGEAAASTASRSG